MSRRSPRWLRWAGWLCLPLLAVVFRPAVAEGHYVALPGGGFASVLPTACVKATVHATAG